ncbi:5,10-methylenetetrahydrofolate reductase [Thauera sp. GDN1]|nr:5,10-methylenetetrahydrofolate reductase [Thauera sp. GDN1]
MTSPVPQFSAEIFPSETVAGLARLEQTVRTLHALGPDFVSVTYGAGGSTRGTSQVALDRLRAAGIAAVPHLSALGASRQDMRSQLDTCRDAGVRRLVVLRGDAPSGLRAHGEFTFATDLVRFIREETAGRFHIDVAAYPECHPQARSADADLAHFKAKFDAGANSAITQYFFNADAYADFLERCTAAGIHAPIVPGVMPIGRFARLVQFSEARGIEVPRWIRRRMEAFGDDNASIRAFGIEVVVRLCERLLAMGAPGLHFFSLNDGDRVAEIWRALGLPPRLGAGATTALTR